MADWYVATTGNDTTGNGSSGNPYATLQKAHDVASANDTVYIAAGTYTATCSGTKNLTVIGYGGQVLFYGATAINGDAWVLHAANVWRKPNVTLRDGTLPVRTDQALIFLPAAGGYVKGWQMDDVGEVDSASTYGIKFFYDRTPNDLYVYSTSDPTTAFSAVHYTSNSGTAGTVLTSSGGIVWTGATLTMRNVDVYGWDGNGVLIYNGSADIANCDISFNREDGYGGHRGTNPAIRRSKMRFNGVRRARDPLLFSDVLPDGDGHSWHAHAGVQTTGIIDEFNYYEGNTKDAFQHIDASTGTCVGAVIKNCNFNIIYFQSGTQTLVSADITAGPNDVGGIGFLNTGTVNIYGCTLYGAGVASVPAFSVPLGDPANLRGCAIKNWAVGYSSAGVPGTESHNGWNVTALSLTPAGTSFTTTFTLLGNDHGITRTSPLFGTGVAISGLNFDKSGKLRPATPSVGAMEPSRAGSGSGGSVLIFD
jgi:hypothetical protein